MLSLSEREAYLRLWHRDQSEASNSESHTVTGCTSFIFQSVRFSWIFPLSNYKNTAIIFCIITGEISFTVTSFVTSALLSAG